MAELSYDSYIELDIGFSGVQKKVTAWVVKCRTFHAVVYWMFIFFNILTVYDFMLDLSKVLLNTSSKYTAVKMDNGISIKGTDLWCCVSYFYIFSIQINTRSPKSSKNKRE